MSPVNTGGVQQPDDPDVIRTLIEALASGKCDAAAFLQATRERFKSDPDANWEVLSQLDQYFRRGRIPTETFRVVKTALAESALRIVNAQPPADVAGAQAAPAPMFATPVEPLRPIPVAIDVVAPPRAEQTDAHPRRESTPSPDATDQPKPGSVLRRRYRLETPLGQGSSGQVYQALDEFRLESPGGQRVAVKVLHPAVVKRAELFAELRREFQTLQLLSHPNIVRVHEFDRDGSVVFFTMELLNGATLSRVVQARRLAPLPEDQALAVVREIGSGLAHGHAQNLVHGDVSPHNVFVTARGIPRLLGFPGMPFATSVFSSCQVLEGNRPEARDDVFSLACIAYLLFSGEHPLKEKTALEARASRLVIRRPAQVSHRQWSALRAGLRWDREGRPADVRSWLLQLDPGIAGRRLSSLSDLLETPPLKKQMSPWTAVTAAAVVLLLAGAYWFISQRGSLPRLNASDSSRVPSPELAPPVSAPDVSTPANAPPTAASAPPTAAPAQAAPRPASAPIASKNAPVAPAPTAPPATVAATRTPATTAPVTSTPVTSTPATSTPTTSAPATSAPATSTHTTSAPAERAAAPIAGASSPVAAARSSKVELAADTVDVPLGEPAALVSVHRKGNLHGETTFTWWTESGTAKPGTDFSAVVPQIAHIGDGKSSVVLSIALSNAPHTAAKSFYVVIDENEGGAALAGRTLTMVTLQPAD